VFRALTFASLVFLAGIVSVLFHELGHCLFYWLQGVPAAMSFVKEFPLRDITASEYAVVVDGGFTDVRQVDHVFYQPVLLGTRADTE